MTFRSILPLCAVLAGVTLALSGCDSLNRALGKTRVIPDEFQVVSNDPLAIPPDYALRPPRVGNGPEQISPTQQARESVFRVGVQQAALPPAATARSPGETALLMQTGAANASPDIREKVDTDPQTGVPFERSLVDKLIFWQGPTTPPANEVINPTEEAARLRQAQSVVKTTGPAPAPAETGGIGTPTFERTKPHSWFDWLF